MAETTKVETAVVAEEPDMHVFDLSGDGFYAPSCFCTDCLHGMDDPKTLERVAKWLEGRALGRHPGSEQTFFYREIARDIRDGRIDR